MCVSLCMGCKGKILYIWLTTTTTTMTIHVSYICSFFLFFFFDLVLFPSLTIALSLSYIFVQVVYVFTWHSNKHFKLIELINQSTIKQWWRYKKHTHTQNARVARKIQCLRHSFTSEHMGYLMSLMLFLWLCLVGWIRNSMARGVVHRNFNFDILKICTIIVAVV